MTPLRAAAPDPALSPRDNDTWLRELADPGTLGAEAQRALRKHLVTGLRTMLARRGVAEDWCEDFAQEAMSRIRARLGDFRGESRFTTWALSIATRVAFDELRHRRWKDVSFDALTSEHARPLSFEEPGEDTPERRLVRDRVLGALREAIDQGLTPKQRSVLLAELEEMPHADIALALGMKRNAVYKLSHDARKKVKQALESAGVTALDALGVFE